MGGHANKHNRGEDEENVNIRNTDSVVCKPTDLTGLMTPGPEPDGGSPVLAWT